MKKLVALWKVSIQIRKASDLLSMSVSLPILLLSLSLPLLSSLPLSLPPSLMCLSHSSLFYFSLPSLHSSLFSLCLPHWSMPKVESALLAGGERRGGVVALLRWNICERYAQIRAVQTEPHRTLRNSKKGRRKR